MFSYENEVFLDMVSSGDWSRNPSDFHDAVKTLKLGYRRQSLTGTVATASTRSAQP